MGVETKITISLPAEVIADLEADIAEGRYPSIDAAIEDAVKGYLARRDHERLAKDRLHDLLDEAEKGPWFDGEEVFRELIEECEAEVRAKGL